MPRGAGPAGAGNLPLRRHQCRVLMITPEASYACLGDRHGVHDAGKLVAYMGRHRSRGGADAAHFTSAVKSRGRRAE